MLLLLVGGGAGFGATGAARGVDAANPPRVRPPVEETPKTGASVPLWAAMDAMLVGEPGVYGVVVVGDEGKTLYARDADAPFVAASLYKLVLMVAIEAAAEAGDLTLDEEVLVEGFGWMTIEEALDRSITQSNNETALALWEVVGAEAINGAAAELGMDDTCVACETAALPGWPAATVGGGDRAAAFVLDASTLGWINLTTPRDVARFYGLLLDGEVVDRRFSARMLRMLERQEVNDRFPVLLPSGTGIAHKTGNLPGVVHDAGVIETPAGPVVLVALSQDVPDECRAVLVLRRVAALVFAAHGGDAPTEPVVGAATGCGGAI